MNKDLLLIFVVSPLVVEITKALIKEWQDRRNNTAYKKELKYDLLNFAKNIENEFLQLESKTDLVLVEQRTKILGEASKIADRIYKE